MAYQDEVGFAERETHSHPPVAPGSYRVWDPLVRIFHWALVGLFAANAFITAPKHALHHYIGYTIAGLVAFRVIWGLIGARHAQFRNFPPSPSAALGQLRDMATGRRHAHIGHSPLGALMIYNLLLTLIVIAGSGWLMTTDAYWGIQWPKDVHEIAVNWAEASVAAHIAAVIFESRRLRVNLARAMITGTKIFRGERK